MSKLNIDWDAAPGWAQWAAQDVNADVWWRENKPMQGDTRWLPSCGAASRAKDSVSFLGHATYWRDTCVQRPQIVRIHQDNDGAGMLRAQIAHLLEDMPAEQLDALYAHVRKQLDAAKFDELNRHLDKPFGEVPREWQLKAFEAYLDGNPIEYRDAMDATSWRVAHSPNWAAHLHYRVKSK